MKNRRLFFVYLLVLLLTVNLTAEASTVSNDINPTLGITGTTATCRIKVFKPGRWITVTMVLHRDGIPFRTWTDSGTSLVSLNETCTVITGHTYYVYVYGSANGLSFNGQSSSITI